MTTTPNTEAQVPSGASAPDVPADRAERVTPHAAASGVTPWSHRVRIVRIASGLVLFYYVFVHLTNHALGNISLDLMEVAQEWMVGAFRRLPGTILLGGAALIHFSLALYALYLKRRFRMPLWEATQLVLGFLIPILLIEHFVAARMAREIFGAESAYSFIIWGMRADPWAYVIQVALLCVAWSHGCMGIHYWLRFRKWYPRVAPAFAVIALTLPILALLGFLQAVREVERHVLDPRWQRAFRANVETIGPDGAARLVKLELELLIALAIIAVLLLAARLIRRIVERRHGIIQISYPDGVVTSVRPGQSVLEVSRAAGIAHASVCGGRSRCSTCRVRVGAGLDALPPPGPHEARILQRIGAAHNVRLACQIRPSDDIEVTPLFPVPPDMDEVRNVADHHHGREMEIAVMFADLRGFTSASEHQLPYDTLFILNRYFREMGTAIHEEGGIVDKFIGDGIMALFGINDGVVQGTTNALKAAQRMSKRLESLNKDLRDDMKYPLKIGIGIHSGIAIVGKVGWGRARALTAIGDTVNIASRIEGLTKRFDCELLISAQAADIVGAGFGDCERRETDVRGRTSKIEVVIVPTARNLKIVDSTL